MDSRQLLSSAGPPAFSEDSLFFNLILGTNYENTKDNCLQFLKNYSKNMFYPKREIFKILINELILNESSTKMLDINENNECIYLMRQLIKKYSKTNIVNALYDYISEKENDFFPPVIDNNLNNTSVESSLNKLQSSQSEKDSKSVIDNNINIFPDMIKHEVRSQSYVKKENNKFFKKKKRYPESTRSKSNKNKNKKKIRNGKANKKLIKKAKEKQRTCKKEKDNINDKYEEMKIENLEIEIKKENTSSSKANNETEYQEITNNDEKGRNNEENKDEEKKSKINSYKLKLRNKSSNKSKTSDVFKLKTEKKENVIKLKHPFSVEKQNNDELKLYKSMPTSLMISNNNNSNTQRDKNQMNITSYLNQQKIKNEEIAQNENQYTAHLVKIKEVIYSYKIKRHGGIKDNVIYFECNNRKCRGRAKYDIEKKIFQETVKHSISTISHNISFLYYSMRDELLKDKDSDGYQILKDNSYIKDEEVVFLK